MPRCGYKILAPNCAPKALQNAASRNKIGGRPFTKDILAKDIRQVREKLGIPSELKLLGSTSYSMD